MTGDQIDEATRVRSIPPRIRALAKIVHDSDISFFPNIHLSEFDIQAKDLSEQKTSRRKSVRDGGVPNPTNVQSSTYTANSVLSRYNQRALDGLLSQLQDGEALTAEERNMFHDAFVEYSQHLRGVDFETLRVSIFGPVLKLTTLIDAECTYVGVPLGEVLTSVIRIHDICLQYAHHDTPPKLVIFVQTFVRIFSEHLKKILDEIVANSQGRVGSFKALPLPKGVVESLIDMNAKLTMEVAQFEWFIQSAMQNASGHFDANDHVTDLSVREVWSAYVGLSVPMCTTDHFSPALAMFPSWAQEWMMDVLDLNGSGVVSIFTLQRLLALWGPYLLIDRNMQRDISTGMFSLKQAPERCEQLLRSDGQPGDYIVSLGKNHGSVNISIVTTSKRVQTILADRSSGAWILNGVSAEDFATISDAVGQFPQLFARPRGDTVIPAQEGSIPESPGKLKATASTDVTGTATAVTTAPSSSSSKVVQEDVFSIFHRACFHNNVQYVKTLIHRGAAVLVNTSVADPLITSQFSWTPLLCAVNNPNGDPDEVTRALIACGADVAMEDEATCTALYYAIANGYPNTVKLLLQQDPGREASSTTNLLMMSLGAHNFNASDLDNIRLADTLPTPQVVGEILLYVRSWNLVKLAIAIIESKLYQRELTLEQGLLICDEKEWKRSTRLPILTQNEVEVNKEAIAAHGRLCREFPLEVRHVLRLLRMHSFKLSCLHHFGQQA